MATRPTTAAFYFTESLVDAFAGRRWVDRDGDGTVILEELAEHMADELAFTGTEAIVAHAAARAS